MRNFYIKVYVRASIKDIMLYSIKEQEPMRSLSQRLITAASLLLTTSGGSAVQFAW